MAVLTHRGLDESRVVEFALKNLGKAIWLTK
jgi:hypothetical protein